MTSDDPRPAARRSGRARSVTLGTILVCACAVSITWAWNTVITDVSGLARVRFAEGLAIAVSILLTGAVFEAGRRLAAGPRPEPAKPQRQ